MIDTLIDKYGMTHAIPASIPMLTTVALDLPERWKAAKFVLRSLKKTADYGISYTRDT